MTDSERIDALEETVKTMAWYFKKMADEGFAPTINQRLDGQIERLERTPDAPGRTETLARLKRVREILNPDIIPT